MTELRIHHLATPGSAEGLSFDPRAIYDLLLRRWRLIVGTGGFVCLLVLIVLLSLTPRYTATTQILLDPSKENAPGVDTLLSDLTLDSSMVDSQVTLIESSSLLRRVVEKENLKTDPEFGIPPSQPNIFVRMIHWIFGSKSDDASSPAADASSDDETIPEDELVAIKNLISALEVEREGQTYVLDLSVTSEDPEKAARLANAVANAYLVDQLEAHYDSEKRASSWLNDRLQSLAQELRKSEEAVQDFRTSHHLTATKTGTVTEQQLSELNANLVSARADVAERKAKWQQAEKLVKEGGNLDAIPDVVQSPVIADLRKQEAEVSGREADLVTRYGDRHPLVVNVRAQRADIERQINAEVQRIISNLKNSYDVAATREKSLEQSLEQLTGETNLDNASAIRLGELQRVADANRMLYDKFLSQAKITNEASTFETKDSRVISAAAVPSSPSFPRIKPIMAFALLLGLGLGGGAAYYLDLLDSSFTSPKQLEEQLSLPVLASIPLLSDEDLGVGGRRVQAAQLCMVKPLSRYSEAIRTLRAGVELADLDNPPQVVMVTSALPKDGKTTVSMSLVFSAAKAGLRALLIDCDLRRPAISAAFRVDRAAGLVDLLRHKDDEPQRYIHAYPEGFSVLGVGTAKTQSPPDILGSVRMRDLITRLRSAYDLIVVDTPPLGPVVDSVVMARLVDQIVMVVRWSSTPRDMVANCLAALSSEKKVAGFAFNMIDEKQMSRYGRYAYYGQKYYGEYYTE